MAHKINYLALDWDGTVCNSIPDAYRATCSTFKRLSLIAPTMLEYLEYQRPPYVQFYYDRGVPSSVSSDQIWEWYLAAANHHENKLFMDSVPAISNLLNNGCKIVLVTGQKKKTVEHILQAHYCPKLFDHMLCETMPSKTPHFLEACRLLNAEPEQVYAVGDVAWDMIEAREANLIPIGIKRCDEKVDEILRRAGATRVITSLYDLLI
jgi:phosphoglycolate phosphatase-like HAD superfamily hydrolase